MSAPRQLLLRAVTGGEPTKGVHAGFAFDPLGAIERIGLDLELGGSDLAELGSKLQWLAREARRDVEAIAEEAPDVDESFDDASEPESVEAETVAYDTLSASVK